MEKVRVAVGHRGENVRDEFFRKQHGALGLATGTEISGAAWEGQKVLTADDYFHGHLDWYNLDIREATGPLDGDVTPVPELPGGITQTVRY